MTDGKGTAAKTKPFISKENAQNRPEPIQWGQGDFGRFCISGADRQLGSKKEVPAMPPYAGRSQERMGVWKRTPLFLRGGDDRDGYENRLCGENWRYDFRCQRNARRERKAHAGGDCKSSDCKRSNGFAGSGYCLIDFTRNYALWGFFKKYLKTT